MLRGGVFLDPEGGARCACRLGSPVSDLGSWGFRVAASPDLS